MQAIKAVFDGVNFKPKQAIPVSGQYEVVITFVEQISIDPDTDKQERINREINFLKEISRLAADASDEVLTMDDFPRTKFSRELIVFDDEVYSYIQIGSDIQQFLMYLYFDLKKKSVHDELREWIFEYSSKQGKLWKKVYLHIR